MLKALKETREHTKSYYAATANWQTRYPTVEGNVSVDVCVVGAGFTGVSSALFLAERGYKVALVEANRIGWGESGRNGGQVIGGIGHDATKFKRWIGDQGVRAIREMGIECVEVIRERVEKYNIDCGLTWGLCEVGLKERHIRDFMEAKEEEEALGYPHRLRLLNAEEVRGLIHSDLYCGGLLNETGAGQVHSLNLCIGEARAAEKLGAKIFEQSRVEKIVYGKRPKVITERGSVEADHVVLCGSGYQENLVPRLARRVLPAASFLIATEPLGKRAHDIMARPMAACDPRTALDYFRLSADNRLIFGGMSNYTGLAPTNVTRTMQQKMLTVFPQLKGVKIEHTWGGQMGIGLNRMPQLGRLKGDNVYYVQAFSGHGVAPAHIMGKLVAEVIGGQAERFDVFSKIKHLPFPGGRVLGRPAFALGMLYYRLKDLL
ncbi:MAG: FAD-binding oxidoreductase [Pseudomonadota bacterium]